MERVKTKEELNELVKKYKRILNKEMYDYLRSLIELKISIIKENISEEDKYVLSELDIYKLIGIYNIYNRALNIFNKQDSDLRIMGNDERVEGLTVYLPNGNDVIKIFNFNYSKDLNGMKDSISDCNRTSRIGEISLYQTLENKEISEMRKAYEKLLMQQNPYSLMFNLDVYSFSATNWENKHIMEIKRCEQELKEMSEKIQLSEKDKKEIAITKKYYELLINDYGLDSNSFIEEYNDSQSTNISKILVKKQPNIIIKNNIKYIN